MLLHAAMVSIIYFLTLITFPPPPTPICSPGRSLTEANQPPATLYEDVVTVPCNATGVSCCAVLCCVVFCTRGLREGNGRGGAAQAQCLHVGCVTMQRTTLTMLWRARTPAPLAHCAGAVDMLVTSAAGKSAPFNSASSTLPVLSLAECPASTCPGAGVGAANAAAAAKPKTSGALRSAASGAVAAGAAALVALIL